MLGQPALLKRISFVHLDLVVTVLLNEQSVHRWVQVGARPNLNLYQICACTLSISSGEEYTGDRRDSQQKGIALGQLPGNWFGSPIYAMQLTMDLLQASNALVVCVPGAALRRRPLSHQCPPGQVVDHVVAWATPRDV